MDNQTKKQFRQSLLEWYYKEKRDLPWRKSNNPYYIWISEVMLQQTKVDTVIPYYNKFIEAYPTIESMANATEEHVLKNWEGLGYYSRARNLHIGVKEVYEKYGGQLPKTREEISSIRGIGPYTAGAILSIAFQIPEHAVDGNVMRVFSRILWIEEDIAKPKTKKTFEHAVMELIDHDDPSGFNQALMELGATICTPTKPSCVLCPVNAFCEGNLRGQATMLPIKSKKAKATTQKWQVIIHENEQGLIYIEKRPEQGLLANMWQFPMYNLLEETKQEKHLLQLKHVFTHLIWELDVYVSAAKEVLQNGEWKTIEEIESLPMPVPMIKILEAYKKERQTCQK